MQPGLSRVTLDVNVNLQAIIGAIVGSLRFCVNLMDNHVNRPSVYRLHVVDCSQPQSYGWLLPGAAAINYLYNQSSDAANLVRCLQLHVLDHRYYCVLGSSPFAVFIRDEC